jgi:hypothetical protein
LIIVRTRTISRGPPPVRVSQQESVQRCELFSKFVIDLSFKAWFNWGMKIKARVNPQGMMGSAPREHKVKKGKGSFKRREKHKKVLG